MVEMLLENKVFLGEENQQRLEDVTNVGFFHLFVLKCFKVMAQSLNKPQSEKFCFCLSPLYQLLKMTHFFLESSCCLGRAGCSLPWGEDWLVFKDTQLSHGHSKRGHCLATDFCKKIARKKWVMKYLELHVSCPRVQRGIIGATQTLFSISFLTFGTGSAE